MSRPTFSREVEIAIATKRPEEMTPEELDAKRRIDEWCRAESEERERKKKASEAAGRAYVRQYWDRLSEQDRNASARTLEWFAAQVEKGCRPEPPLRLQMGAEDAARYLKVAYEGEVKRRGGALKDDIYTASVVRHVGRWLTAMPKPGLMLRGYIGVGKTTMMLAVKRTLQLLTDNAMTVADAREIAALCRESPSEFSALKRCRMLGIDDLGTESVVVRSYGNESSPLAELIAARYSSRLLTVITTNLSVVTDSRGEETDELRKVYGDRIFDRLREMCNTIVYDGSQPSYRV